AEARRRPARADHLERRLFTRDHAMLRPARTAGARPDAARASLLGASLADIRLAGAPRSSRTGGAQARRGPPEGHDRAHRDLEGRHWHDATNRRGGAGPGLSEELAGQVPG